MIRDRNKISFCIISGIALFGISCNQEKIELGERHSFTINSEFTDASYTIQVRLPLNYSESETYDTIYTLDGNWYFDHVSEESAQISEYTNEQNVIVVGIGHGNSRTTDYTPTKTSEGEGGARKFTEFISGELIPYMEEHFFSDSNRRSRVILGHSVGGLFTAYVFTKHNHLFGNYIMLSPSIWYDDGISLHYESDNRDINESSSQLVFISVAELEPTQLFTHMFYERLKTYENTELAFHTVKRKNHSTSAEPAITEALSFYFSLKDN